jgi:hypothetical protein
MYEFYIQYRRSGNEYEFPRYLMFDIVISTMLIMFVQ